MCVYLYTWVFCLSLLWSLSLSWSWRHVSFFLTPPKPFLPSQDEYLAEGIKWTPIEYFNNKVICELVDQKMTGIIAQLDEESIRPGEKTDAAWLSKLSKSLASHPHFKGRKGPTDKAVPEGCFMLVHYAGNVVYTAEGFLSRNTDTLFKNLSRLMFKSKNKILRSCFPDGDESTWVGAVKRPPTAGKAFITSMQSMIELLNTKIPNYVRCIKPNQKKAPRLMDDELLSHQIKYLGLVENVRVRRAGFCFREPMAQFFWRYRMLSEHVSE
jgi:myosin I